MPDLFNPDAETPEPESKMTALAKHEPQAEIVRPADPMVAMIERVVMDPNADLAKLEKMLEMRERLEAQQARKAFDLAISQAKAEIGPIAKNRMVSFGEGQKKTEYRHEDLAEIARTVDPILSAHGLSYRFRSAQGEGGRITVTCVLSHRDGFSEETALSGSPDTSGSKNNFQAVGSAVSYLQRYTLKLALGLAASNDDDAKGASGGVETISEAQYRTLRDLIEKAGTTEESVCSFFHVETLPDLPAVSFEAAAGMLRTRIAKKAGA